MRKIDVNSYKIEVKEPTTNKLISIDYNVKELLVGVLLHPSLQIAGAELYIRMPIADKIKKADGEVLLEEEEYAKILDAVNRIQGFGMNDSELVRRVIEAKEITVSETNNKPDK